MVALGTAKGNQISERSQLQDLKSTVARLDLPRGLGGEEQLMNTSKAPRAFLPRAAITLQNILRDKLADQQEK